MLNQNNERELVYVVRIDEIRPIEGADNVELACVGGWRVMVRKNVFHPGSLAIYFEIDSKVPETKYFEFMAKYNYRVKTQKYFKGKVLSQGLIMPAEDVGGETLEDRLIINGKTFDNEKNKWLAKELGVIYYEPTDNVRKGLSDPNAKYKAMAGRHPKLFQNPIIKKIYKNEVGKKILYFFFGGKKKEKKTQFPTHFSYIKKTDAERCENMPWILEDKTPFIITQKCDGSSGTFILEKKKFGRYEFYVCSRNVRQLTPNQKCFYDDNCYWDVAIKYDIENKMKDYMKKHPNLQYLCWQGEVCGPAIQKNPHKLKENHLFLFHCIDSEKGKWDIREAESMWKSYNMEVVPIVNIGFILPDDFDEFKLQADGYYDSSVCEGNEKCPREGFVYYKTNDPNFHFKNVSRIYLLKHNS